MTAEQVSRRAFIAVPPAAAAVFALNVGITTSAEASSPVVIECLADLIGDE